MIDVKLYLGDCLDVLPTLEAGSVDAVVTDPPYGTTACKWDTVIPFEPMWKQLKRIVKPRGATVMTASQPFTTTLIISNLKMFKYCWVWDKGRGTGFQICKIKPMCSHEDVVVFGEGRVTYNPQMRDRKKPRLSKNKGTTRQMLVSGGKPFTADEPLTQRYPVTVIHFGNNNQKAKISPTQKPVALMEYLIKTYTNEGETVLDFAMGSGTTGVACINTGRNFIGIEIVEQTFLDARERIAKAQAEMVQLSLT